MLEQFTYSQLKKKEHREEIKDIGFASVGTKAGHFGEYKEEFRVISVNGADSIKSELEYTAELIGVSYDEMMEMLPNLKEMLK